MEAVAAMEEATAVAMEEAAAAKADINNRNNMDMVALRNSI